FMLQHFAGAYPAWYVEGFAEYMQTVNFEDNRVLIGAPAGARTGWLFHEQQIPIADMLRAPHSVFDTPAKTEHFYAQAWLMVHYVFETPERRQKLRAYLSALRAGGDPVAAFQPAFGETPDDFARELLTYQRRQVSIYAMARTPEPDADLHVSSLPETA